MDWPFCSIAAQAYALCLRELEIYWYLWVMRLVDEALPEDKRMFSRFLSMPERKLVYAIHKNPL